MGTYVLWVRHCESCSNVIAHSKNPYKLAINFSQGAMIPPNCTIIGLIQSYMFGNRLLPELLKNYSNFKRVDFFSSILKRAMITSKIISYGLYKSKYKVKRSNTIKRICNISERLSLLEKITKRSYTNKVSLKGSKRDIKSINKRYKNIGNKLSHKLQKKTHKCNSKDYNRFLKETLPTLNPKSLNLIVSHGKFLKKHLKLKISNNLDAILVRYDKDSKKPKILEKIYNMTDISKTVNSYRNINRDRYNFNYQSDSINLKTSITYNEFKKIMKSLENYLQFEKRINEITCK